MGKNEPYLCRSPSPPFCLAGGAALAGGGSNMCYSLRRL